MKCEHHATSNSDHLFHILYIRFAELSANPAKAKKPHNRPKNASEFARKYLQGFYSLVEGEDEDSRADSKSHK